MDTLKVEECMKYMVSLGLFDSTENGTVSCMKLAKFLGESSTRNTKLKGIIKEAKGTVKSQTVSDNPRLSKDCHPDKRREDKRRDKFVAPTLEEVKDHLKTKGYDNVNADAFIANYEANGWMVGKNKMKCWKAATAKWQHNNFNQPTTKPTTRSFL